MGIAIHGDFVAVDWLSRLKLVTPAWLIEFAAALSRSNSISIEPLYAQFNAQILKQTI
jgi:hypothetical protein